MYKAGCHSSYCRPFIEISISSLPEVHSHRAAKCRLHGAIILVLRAHRSAGSDNHSMTVHKALSAPGSLDKNKSETGVKNPFINGS